MEQTISLKTEFLEPNKGKRRKLEEQSKRFSKACQWYYDQIEELETTSRTELHNKLYHKARERFDLHSGLLQCAMDKALGAYKSIRTKEKDGEETSKPKFNNHMPILVRQDLYRVVTNKNGTFFVKLPGRNVIPLVNSPYHREKLTRLLGGSVKHGSAEVFYDGGVWWITITLIYKIQFDKERGILGVDLGIVKLAVCSTSDGEINKFFDGRQARWRRERWAERRQGLQKSERRYRVKKEQGHEERWMTNLNHVISRRIVDLAKENNLAIALEHLKGIRQRCKYSKRFNRMLSGWAFRELATFIEYKAKLAGVKAYWIDPRKTSRTCSKCGAEVKSRSPWSWFKCPECGFKLDADLNAARNIAVRAKSSMSEGQVPSEDRSVTPEMEA